MSRRASRHLGRLRRALLAQRGERRQRYWAHGYLAGRRAQALDMARPYVLAEFLRVAMNAAMRAEFGESAAQLPDPDGGPGPGVYPEEEREDLERVDRIAVYLGAELLRDVPELGPDLGPDGGPGVGGG